jgi:hypothetical protein
LAASLIGICQLKNEIEVCYYNLKPTTTNNNTVMSGINANAVPARASYYTAGTPAQTSAAAFQTGGSEAFFYGSYYWSSTQESTSRAWTPYFNNGYMLYYNKTMTVRVRAIRRVAV